MGFHVLMNVIGGGNSDSTTLVDCEVHTLTNETTHPHTLTHVNPPIGLK